jgi:inner membrane protein
LDPLTHTLVGGLLAATPLGREARRPAAAPGSHPVLPYAAVVGLVGANLPDLDVLAYIEGADAALGCRRGWTHGPLAILLMPLLLVGTARLAHRFRRALCVPAPPWGRLLALAAAAVWSHPLLDWLNTYGIRLLMPFREAWSYGDALYIIDPWVWLGLGGALFVATSQRARALIGWAILALVASGLMVLAPRPVPRAVQAVFLLGVALFALWRWRRGATSRPAHLAVAALMGLVLYAALMVGVRRAGQAWVADELSRRGVAPIENLLVGPVLGNPFTWEVVAALPEGYRHGHLRWLSRGSPRPALELAPDVLAPTTPSPLVEAALAAAPGTAIWLRFPFYAVEEHPDGYRVRLLDARYVRGPGEGFGETVVVVVADGG